MVASVALWTFVFFNNAASGRAVYNMTEQACHRLKEDAARVYSGHYGKVGDCYPQAKWVN